MKLNFPAIALRYRKAKRFTDRAGVVVIFDGLPQGWVAEMPDPAHWQPGCIAVDTSGLCWLATGGNAAKGARLWQSM